MAWISNDISWNAFTSYLKLSETIHIFTMCSISDMSFHKYAIFFNCIVWFVIFCLISHILTVGISHILTYNSSKIFAYIKSHVIREIVKKKSVESLQCFCIKHNINVARWASLLAWLTDESPGGTACIDIPLTGGVLRWEVTPDQGVQNWVSSVRHHWGISFNPPLLGHCKERFQWNSSFISSNLF